jgi:hypothetical protein
MSTAHWQARRLPIPAAWPARSSRAVHPWAMISAGLAPILLTGAYLMAGLLQPASYSPVRTTISVMAGQAGTDRWVMTGGIVLVSGCYLVTAAGLTGVRASARALLALAGLAGIGIAASPEPARGATPRHLAWTVLGAVTIAVWPAFAARRAAPRPLILSAYGSAAVTAVFVALLGWLLAETRDGTVLGLAERLTTSIQTCWPFIIAVTLRRTPRPRPGPATGRSGGVKDRLTARARDRGRRLLGDSALSAPARKFVGGDVLACSSRVGRATPRVLGGVRGGPSGIGQGSPYQVTGHLHGGELRAGRDDPAGEPAQQLDQGGAPSVEVQVEPAVRQQPGGHPQSSAAWAWGNACAPGHGPAHCDGRWSGRQLRQHGSHVVEVEGGSTLALLACRLRRGLPVMSRH